MHLMHAFLKTKLNFASSNEIVLKPIGYAPQNQFRIDFNFKITLKSFNKMEKSELSKIFTAVMDKSIVNNLSHTAEEIKSIIDDKKLTTCKKAELLECNSKIDTFIQKYTNEEFSVMTSQQYIQDFSGIQNMLSRQSPGRRFFVVPWIHPILNTMRFSKWAPAKNVTSADLGILERKSNELAVAHIKPEIKPITLVNVPKSEGNLAVNSVNKAPTENSRTVLEDSDSERPRLPSKSKS